MEWYVPFADYRLRMGWCGRRNLHPSPLTLVSTSRAPLPLPPSGEGRGERGLSTTHPTSTRILTLPLHSMPLHPPPLTHEVGWRASVADTDTFQLSDNGWEKWCGRMQVIHAAPYR